MEIWKEKERNPVWLGSRETGKVAQDKGIARACNGRITGFLESQLWSQCIFKDISNISEDTWARVE
jgi:hypothetical protein